MRRKTRLGWVIRSPWTLTVFLEEKQKGLSQLHSLFMERYKHALVVKSFFLLYAALICFPMVTLFCPQFFLRDIQRKAKSAHAFFAFQMAK